MASYRLRPMLWKGLGRILCTRSVWQAQCRRRVNSARSRRSMTSSVCPQLQMNYCATANVETGRSRHFARQKTASFFPSDHREVGHRPADWGVISFRFAARIPIEMARGSATSAMGIKDAQ